MIDNIEFKPNYPDKLMIKQTIEKLNKVIDNVNDMQETIHLNELAELVGGGHLSTNTYVLDRDNNKILIDDFINWSLKKGYEHAPYKILKDEAVIILSFNEILANTYTNKKFRIKHEKLENIYHSDFYLEYHYLSEILQHILMMKFQEQY